MPWTTADVDSHKKGLTDKQKKQWVRIANSILKRLMATGKSEKDAAVEAIKQANGVVNVNSFTTYKSKTEKYEVKYTVHQEKAHIVVPVVMIVEGVLPGSQGPLLHKAEEFGKEPECWNGIPVVIDHPQEDGRYVSANDPEIIDNVAVGKVYHTKLENNSLKADAYLDEDRLNAIAPQVLELINEGKVIEVSMGAYSENDDESGSFNGKDYIGVARNHIPNHLAILTDGQIGACSCEDGCGLGVNATVTGMEKKREELGMSTSEFYAVPKDPPSDSKLPIFDEAHVRNAMARFNQTKGLSADEKAKAKKKILAKAKHFKIDTSGFEEVGTNAEFIEGLNSEGFAIHTLSINEEQGMNEVMDLISTEIRKKNTKDSWCYVEDVFPGYFIYSYNDTDERKLYKQEYEIEGGKINLVGSPTEVRRKVEYIANKMVRTKNKEVEMPNECKPCIKAAIDNLIANGKGRFAEEDRTWLETLDEGQLKKLEPIEKVVEKEVQVNALSDEDKAALAAYKKEQKERREQKIKEIQTNSSKELWPDETLNAMSDENLDRLVNSVKKPETGMSFIGNGSNMELQTNAGEPPVMKPAGMEKVEQK